ncbi:zinc-dependent alcohol dehydrogenase [Phytomonospora sp. NPDC050363]|uniref:zinc-dependent alcohol dehydrogenase n=1 Tax=Phytomonospora sp. NPDC050363 TaxID=3155642 RepID=UPI0033F41015
MRAVVWRGPKTVRVEDVPDPKIEEPTDAIVKVTGAAVCGSDLHLYDHGMTMAMKPGDVLGHEAMGEVVEVGAEVKHVRPGDTVVVPFNISCGHCALCRLGLYSQCETTQQTKAKKGAALFGYTHMYGGVPGGQAEFLRVPQAQFGPIKVEESDPPAALLLSDVLPTAWEAVDRADVPEGGTVVVFGLGPVGQMCVTAAYQRGAGRVIAVDKIPDRIAMATANGAECVDYSAFKDVTETVREMTGGRGADSVIDAVGMDADGSAAEHFLQLIKVQPDRFLALHQSLATVRRGGTVSVIGVYLAWMPFFPIGDLFDKQITLRWGQANVRRWDAELLALLRDGDPLRAGALITHEAALEDAPEMYRRFKSRGDGVIKAVLRP